MQVLATIDHEHGKIKLIFDDKPPPNILKELHKNKWRFNYSNKHWSKYQTKAAITYAEELTGNSIITKLDPKDCDHSKQYVGSSGITVCPTCNSLRNITNGKWYKIKDHIVPPEDKYAT